MTLTHLSLFSGIGGLDLAAEWAGIRTVGQCEWAEYPAKVLGRHWPDVPRWKDIRTLTGESFYARTGRKTVDVVSGGFPCQPFSVAGKRRGKDDDRYLWPEMVRVIREIRPAWVVGENVAGIVRMALPHILSELEACGYRTRVFLIPACAVGAWHRRYRTAIVGYAEHHGSSSAEISGSPHAAGGGEPEGKEPPGEFTGAGKPGNGEGLGGTQNMENARCVGFGRKENVYEQPRGTKPERTGKTLPHAESPYARGLSRRKKTAEPGPAGCREDVQHADCTGREEQYPAPEPDQKGFLGRGRNEGVVPDTDNGCVNVRGNRELSTAEGAGRTGRNIGGRTAEHVIGERRTAEPGMGGMADGVPAGMDGDLDFIINHYWDTEPDIPRLAAKTAHRSDRLKCLGNAVVPQQFYPVFRAIVAAEEYRRKK